MMAAAAALAAVTPFAAGFERPVAEVVADLERFSTLLTKWQRVQNLVSRETLSAYWTRHVADSLQVAPLLRPHDVVILDLGSGGGFPSIPLAIAAKGGSRRFVLVEPNGRKASFLRAVVRELSLPAIVEARRAETLPGSGVPAPDVITARAVAPLVELCRLAAPLMRPQSRAIFHKGREHVEELSESSAVWHHDVIVRKSATDAGGVLLELTGLSLKIN